MDERNSPFNYYDPELEVRPEFQEEVMRLLREVALSKIFTEQEIAAHDEEFREYLKEAVTAEIHRSLKDDPDDQALDNDLTTEPPSFSRVAAVIDRLDEAETPDQLRTIVEQEKAVTNLTDKEIEQARETTRQTLKKNIKIINPDKPF